MQINEFLLKTHEKCTFLVFPANRWWKFCIFAASCSNKNEIATMNKEENNQKHVSRREFLRRLGMGAGAAMAMSVMEPLRVFGQEKQNGVGVNRMTYRVQHGSTI